MKQIFRDQYVQLIFISLCFLLIGVCGFMILDSRYTFVDALYMTVFTLSTVGYGEIYEPNTETKFFIIFLIMTGFGLIAFTVVTLAEKVSENIINAPYKRMQKQIQSLTGHYIICGYGRVGRSAMAHLKKQDKSFVVIDQNAEVSEELDDEKVLYIKGDVTHDEVLIKAGIEKASGIMCLLPQDPSNLFLVLTARELNPDIFIISRSESPLHDKRLIRAGADKVTSPFEIAGVEIATSMVEATLSKKGS